MSINRVDDVIIHIAFVAIPPGRARSLGKLGSSYPHLEVGLYAGPGL